MLDRIKLMFSDVWVHLQPTLVLFLTTIGRDVLLAALKAVAMAMSQDQMSSAGKRQYAIDMVKSNVAGAGDRMINLAVEIAVSKLKG